VCHFWVRLTRAPAHRILFKSDIRRLSAVASRPLGPVRPWLDLWITHATPLTECQVFTWVADRFEAGQGYECMAELQEASRRSRHDVIRAWTKFIGAYLSHILRRPLAIYQLASQQVSMCLSLRSRKIQTRLLDALYIGMHVGLCLVSYGER